ncbi:flagellar hook capping protein [Motilimonas cestriensis]|uniref:Basal-body rod modification protein FlgD n=1 Tax=Motilimonas cestriensis TaxID=2742685 RepID=A0ABS8WHB4_9GAMM|nr:flagellar hook capping FlgD N-terminal domain-containing protein [Motilimonas cestriensis]MCE2597123.1 flagellar hook capping protein [Motilimonas cestriensis]
MAVSPISSSELLASQNNVSTNIRQEDFIKLFMSQLKAQDPLEPVNNQDFLVQMAQFSLLESNRQTNQSLEDIRQLVISSQTVGMIGKYAEVYNNQEPSARGALGTIIAVNFEPSGASVTIKTKDINGEWSYLNNVPLGQIKSIYDSESDIK